MLDFQSFISALGFEPPAQISPGRIVRFSTNGRRGDDAGWALLFETGDGGVVGDWRSGEQQVWQAEKVQTYTPEQRSIWAKSVEEARAHAAQLRAAEHEETAQAVAMLWAGSSPATSEHGYLAAKGAGAHGLRIYRGTLEIRGMKCDGALLVPARNVAGQIRTVQFIGADGEKRYMPRGEISGNFFLLGAAGPVICVAEGFATAASVREATGHPVAVAFDAGNLVHVAKALRSKHKDARIIVCADNDVGVKAGKVENPGVTKATEAAEAVGGVVVVPDLNGEKCDFNDLFKAKGKDVVRLIVDPGTSTTMPADGTVRADDSAFLRHMIEVEGRSLRAPSSYEQEVRDRLAGRYKRAGATLPWEKVRDKVVLQPKQVSIWAGINGHGKSALLNQVQMDINLQGQKTWLASLEMPVAATLERMVRQAAGVQIPDDAYITGFHKWIESRLFLHDHVGRETPKKMVAMLRYVHEKTGCQHYVIDSMMRVVRSPDDYSGQKDFIEMLCATAHDLGIHIHVVAHMRKGESEYEQSGKFDVKGASEITDLVDNVFVVWRNKLKEKKLADETDPDRGRWLKMPDTILTCAKQRHGDWEGEINLWFDSATKAYHGTDERREWSVPAKVVGVQDHVPF